MMESESSLTVEEWAKKCWEQYKKSGNAILLPLTRAFETIDFISQDSDRNVIHLALGDLDSNRKRSMESEEPNADPVRLILYGFIEKVQCVILHLIQKIDETDGSSEKKALTDEVNKLKEKIGKLTYEDEQKMAKICAFEEIVQKDVNEISALKNNIHDKDNELTKLKADLEGKAAEVSLGESQIEKLKKELEETKEKAKKYLDAASNHAINLNKVGRKYMKERDELDAKLKEVQLEKTVIERERDGYIFRMTSNEKELTKLSSQLTEVSVRGSQIEKKLKRELAETNEKANKDREAANTQIEKLTEHLDNVKKELGETKEKADTDILLEYLNEEKDRQMEGKDELIAKLKNVQSEKEAIKRERGDFEFREREMKSKLKEMEERTAFFARENANLKEQLAALGVKIEDDPLYNDNEVGENSHLVADSDDHDSTTPTFTHSYPMKSKEEPNEGLNGVTQAISGDTQMLGLHNEVGKTDREGMLNDNMDSAEPVMEGRRRRTSTNGPKLLDDYDYSNFSDEDYNPPIKKSRSDSDKKTKKDKKRSSCKREDQSGSAGKERHVIKPNGSDLECLECEFRSRSVRKYVMHLQKTHDTTPSLAGIAFRCDCGNVSGSNSHGMSCSIANFTVIRKKDVQIRRLSDPKTTPRCVMCETYPSTPAGYIAHLYHYHESTLKAQGIYLLCQCDLKVRSQNDKIHDKECDKLQFTLHEVEKD